MRILQMRWAACALTAGVCFSAAAAPTDNLRADYRNPANKYYSSVTKQPVQLGVGSGYYMTTNRALNGTRYTTYASLSNAIFRTCKIPNLRSSVGVPITAVSANKFLGEELTPPTNWSGAEPDIAEGTGGKAVWIDFAETVIAVEAGPIEVAWPLKGGGRKIEQSVVAASPNKRPVRLYWTHERPESYYDNTYRSLQNAGPTVTFGQNYKVHLYETSKIGVFKYNDYECGYSRDDGRGYVCLNGTELQAFEGSYGTFLIVYSRLDEKLNERKMLAYELVEVMEPKQTQIDVRIGDQLKPQTRDFDTNELFPRVTRGLTDESENGEIYVYQHSTGKQKNYLWAIRDSSANPWKIEVFWRAKEELDVVWPFEVDIYSASWDGNSAQAYIRDTETAAGGEAKREPVVYHPSGVTIEAMDYQVALDDSGKAVEKKHVHLAEGAFYTDWADKGTYALLKYTSGEEVWFQTLRSIPAKDGELLESLGLDFASVVANADLHTGSEFVGAVYTNVAFGTEIRAPFSDADGFFYPGWIRLEHEVANAAAAPVKNPYNIETYAYPTAYMATNELNSQIFPVNVGELEVWWSLPSKLMGAPRENGGNANPLEAQVYFPSVPAVYTAETPEYVAFTRDGMDCGDLPSIVIASGRGSAGYSLYDFLDSEANEWANVLTFFPTAAVDAAIETKLAGMGNPAGVVSNFTFEARLERIGTTVTDSSGGRQVRQVTEIPLVSFYGAKEDGSIEDSPYLKLGYDDNGNFYLNGVAQTPFGYFWDKFLGFSARASGISYEADEGVHLAIVHHEDGTWDYYLNGILAGSFTSAPVALDIARDSAKVFENGKYKGPIHFLRLWSEARTPREIDQNRYLACAATSSLVFQYDGTTQPFENNGDETVLSGQLRDGYVADTSGHDARGYLGYDPNSVAGAEKWFTAGRQRVSFRLPHLGQTLPNDARIYRQNDRELDGYNPNEEHALMMGGVAYALRCDQNRINPTASDTFTSYPYVLVTYADPERPGKSKMCALRVVPENDMYRFRTYYDAGMMIQSPDPLARLQPANLQKFMSGPLYGETKACFQDRKGYYWAHQAGDDGGATNYVFELSYPNQVSFDYTDGGEHAAGEVVPWMAEYAQRDDSYVLHYPANRRVFPARPSADPVGTAIDYTYIVNWPEDVPGLYVNDTLHEAKNGLPAVRGQLSALVIYQQSKALAGRESVRLIDPEDRQAGALPVIPDAIRNYLDVRSGKRKFTDTSPFLRDRLLWNPTAFYDRTHDDTRELELSGKYVSDDTAGFQYSWLNVMDKRSLAMLTDPDTLPGGDDPDWVKGMQSIPTEPIVITDDVTPAALALATTGKGAGYVTLVFNNSTNLEMVPKSETVTMYVIRVVPELYNGKLHVITGENPLDKQVDVKYTSDFGGKPENWEFEWEYAEPVNGKAPSVEDADKWMTLAGACGKPGMPQLDWVTFGDAGKFGLGDWCVRCRYRSLDPEVIATVGDGWTEWCAPQYVEGWIKRVLKAINPFDQKIRNLLENEIDQSLSMIQQAGKPYDGDVPLNLESMADNGLIAIYETVLNQAKKLSIDVDGSISAGDNIALALQMAAGRIAQLYTLLGNEAYADALNPTVDLGGKAGVDTTAESSIFPFMNQCENLLDEELALLRGRDLSADYAESWKAKVEPWNYPVYNRLQWNMTSDIMGGQVAYVENYGLRDVCGAADAEKPDEPDGVIDGYDAANLYPQGHGDAWGHYLSALKGYYALLRHPNFGWRPQIEGILVGQTAVTIGYLHEKRFAQAAELKARVGEKIVADTYRQNYVAGERDTWLQAEDEVTWEDNAGHEVRRAWGTDEWATRAHLGAYYDWLTVNALLPGRTNETGQVRMLDRESTKELGAIAASARRIQVTSDSADAGLNPLGLSENAIPFDISPSEIDAGKTHFEQAYERARRAVKVAKDVFDRVKGVSDRLRDQNAEATFSHGVDDEEAAINRRLIEIYGYPYDDDIGPGKTYPKDYNGPDIHHYYYVETYDLDGSGGINGAYRGVTAGDGSYGRYIDVPVDDYTLITTNVEGTFQAEIDESLADNGFLGNIIVGAISWYQDKLGTVGSYIDPWSKYTGIASTNFALPVAVVDTTGDALDGKVDYSFYVAAWSNNPWVASYYVGPDGFTPKPKDFHGQRRAEGECQIALNGYAGQLANIDAKAMALFAANEKLQGLIDELGALDHTTQMGYVTDAAKVEVENYTAACKKNAETVKTVLEAAKELKDTLTESGVEAFPKLTGLSFDLTSIGRAALLALKSGVNDLMNGQIAEQIAKMGKADEALEELEDALTAQFKAWMDNEERQKKVTAIREQTANVRAALAELEQAFLAANETRMSYQKIVAEGEELQCERERLRIQWAADLSQARYRNMMFQIMRSDELQRYNEAFELAAKYVYLAAKAYDYETGLLKSDSANTAGSEFMSAIVRARSLGRFTADGQPLGGGSAGDPGLADILFRMDENWSVLKGRLGFNNPQHDLDTFSLRADLFGKVADASGDAAWRQALANCWVEDLRTHPAFAQYCQPFDPMQAVEPGFAIPFRTVIAARKDLFGNDLKGGSTAYSSTYFATKLRAVGVWIEGTNAKGALPVRPEVYLIPSGLDYMRVPVKSSTSSAVATRTWSVVDQVLPVPYELGDSDWEANDWSMLKDVFANELCVTRRHPAIRANVGATFDEQATMTYNARLIGRSVWNDQWYVIIPAASLNADSARAKANFLDTVRDIHLNLKTYSFSGN